MSGAVTSASARQPANARNLQPGLPDPRTRCIMSLIYVPVPAAASTTIAAPVGASRPGAESPPL